jgi:RNA polymerase sigma factor (sigma-70 family)
MKVDKTQNELALVCAARRGDREALQALLKHNWSWLKGLVYSVLTSARDLDDVMQEVCVRVITKIQTLREPERFRAWLAVLARREALRHRRQESRAADLRSHGHSSSEGLHAYASVSTAPIHPGDGLSQDGYGDDPAADVEKKELCGRVLEAVRALPEKYRVVFVLAQSGELTYAQMAEVLDIPITTMQIRLVRARRMIRTRINGETEHKVHENEHCG